jgi:hypothetical protein
MEIGLQRALQTHGGALCLAGGEARADKYDLKLKEFFYGIQRVRKFR